MALNKRIELENGIVTNYHRIVSLSKITNNITIVEVASYTSKEKRDEEKENIGQPMNIFINTTYLDKEYNEQESIEDIYDYLKTLDEFNGAEDI